MLLIVWAIVVFGGCQQRSTSTSTSTSSLTCGLPSEEAPSEPPVDACRDGTLVLGPVLFERGHGSPKIETRAFNIPGEMHACISIQSRGGDRQLQDHPLQAI